MFFVKTVQNLLHELNALKVVSFRHLLNLTRIHQIQFGLKTTDVLHHCLHGRIQKKLSQCTSHAKTAQHHIQFQHVQEPCPTTKKLEYSLRSEERRVGHA